LFLNYYPTPVLPKLSCRIGFKNFYGSPVQQNTLIKIEIQPDACLRLLIEQISRQSNRTYRERW